MIILIGSCIQQRKLARSEKFEGHQRLKTRIGNASRQLRLALVTGMTVRSATSPPLNPALDHVIRCRTDCELAIFALQPISFNT